MATRRYLRISMVLLGFGVLAAQSPLVRGDVFSLSISTGFDEATGLTVPDLNPDGDWRVLPPAAGVETDAIVVSSDQYPIFPAGPWDANSGSSKWIGPSEDVLAGVPGNYTYTRQILVPVGIAADKLAIAGYWEIDDIGVDIEVNGVSLKIDSVKVFTEPQPLPPQAGLGLFQPGLNEIVMVVRNSAAAPPNNPTGLRVDAALVLQPDPTDLCWYDLPFASVFAPGANFTAGGANFTVRPLTLMDGTAYTAGSAIVTERGQFACQTGNELAMNNVNIDIDHGAPLSALTIHYGHHGGNINLTVNGDFANVWSFRDLPSSLGGVAVNVIELGRPQSCGVFKLDGLITSLRLGGSELAVDCLERTLAPQFRRGDSNGDALVDIADPVHLAENLFAGGPGLDCPQASEVNGDGANNISDEIVLLGYLFLGTPAPVAPGPNVCGADPMQNTDLGPCTYTACRPRGDGVTPAVELRLRGPGVVSGPPGRTVSFEAEVLLCWQQQAGTMFFIDHVRGWSYGVSRLGGGNVTIQGATVSGTEAEGAELNHFRTNQVLASGAGLVSAAVLQIAPAANQIPPAPLQPTGVGVSCLSPARILRIKMQAQIPSAPGSCYEESFRFDDTLQGSGQQVLMRVALTGRLNGVRTGGLSYIPISYPGITIRVCADNTQSGSSVTVNAGAGVTVTFPQVTTPGYTSATATGSGQPPPRGFDVLNTQGGTSAYYSVTTTAGYPGNVDICFPYTPPPGMSAADQDQFIRLMVHEPALGQWRDVTTSIDTTAHIVCGTTHLSEFGVFRSTAVLPPKDIFRRGDSNLDGQLDAPVRGCRGPAVFGRFGCE